MRGMGIVVDTKVASFSGLKDVGGAWNTFGQRIFEREESGEIVQHSLGYPRNREIPLCGPLG